MDRAKQDTMDIDARITVFHDRFDHDIDPAVTLVALVRAAGDFLGRIVDVTAVDAGMATIIGPLHDDSSDWRESLADAESGAFSEWPLGARLHDLAAYARYGIDLAAQAEEDTDRIAERLAELVAEADAFLKHCPLEAWLGEERPRQLEETILLARNRWALDHLRPVEPDALALFGGVSFGRMRNMVTGKSPMFHRESGLIPAHEALAWLDGRESFLPSIWRAQRPSDDQALPISAPQPYERPVFVPEARDGSLFHPGLERSGGFTIGEKGREVQVPTFDAALQELQRMPVPAWRRPSSRGGWSVVKAVGWARVSREELDSRATSEREHARLN